MKRIPLRSLDLTTRAAAKVGLTSLAVGVEAVERFSLKPTHPRRRRAKPKPRTVVAPAIHLEVEPELPAYVPTPRPKCEHCGEEVPRSRGSTAKTCSTECREQFEQLKRAAKAEAKVDVDRVCAFCGSRLDPGNPKKSCGEDCKAELKRLSDERQRSKQRAAVVEREALHAMLTEFDVGPTDARPGSAEKLAVLAARASRELPLWHPHDAPIAGKEAYSQWSA